MPTFTGKHKTLPLENAPPRGERFGLVQPQPKAGSPQRIHRH
jgi:hypothetical protein